MTADLDAVVGRPIGARQPEIRVLSNPGRWRKGDNPFLKLLFDHLAERVHLIHFTWWRALLGRYDVLHVHWLEYVVLGPSLPVRLAKRTLFLLLLLRLWVTGTPSVWTVHNESPHDDISRVERALLALWASRVSHKVLLNASSRWAGSADASVIPHGHYRPTLLWSDRPAERSGKPELLFFGHLRPYKGIEQLIEVVGALHRHTSAAARTPILSILGRAADPTYESVLRSLVEQHEGIRFVPTFLDDAALEQEIRRADCVVLPYRRMLNSGAALLALSCDKPILVPDSPSMLELRTETGDEWVHIFTPPLGAEDVTSAMRSAAALRPGARPDLSRREWPLIADQYLAVYRAVLGC